MKRFLKFILPHGLVDLERNRRKLRDLGRTIRPNDLFRSDWLVHEAETTGLSLFPAGHVENLRCVVDVGAHVGEWASMLLDLITPQRVVMVEPQPQAFAVLTEKFRGRPGFELHNVAVSDHAGAARLKITRDSTGVSLLAPLPEMRALVGSNWTVESEIEVPVTTLDQLLANEPEISLLKIDVQGVEREVLAGARETLSMTKFVLIELNYMSQYQGGSWFANVHQILTDEHGFFLANASRPLVLNGRASMCDGLYVNPKLVPNFVKPDFV